MAVTDCVVLKELGLDRLNLAASAAIKNGYAPQAGVLIIQGGWYGLVMVKDDTAAVTGCKVIEADGYERLDKIVHDAVLDGYAPYTRIIRGENSHWLVTLIKGTPPGGSSSASDDISVTWADISGKPDVIAAGKTPDEARKAIGAGTSSLAIGTTETTAKAGNYKPASEDITDISNVGKSILKSADAAAVRKAIGAGTSDLALGTTSLTAKPGDYKPKAADISDASTLGRQILQATDKNAVKTLLGILL